MADQISFARGAPSLDLVDVEGLKAAVAKALEQDPAGATAYGTAAGYGPLRQWVADRYGVAVEEVMLTNGSLQADALLFSELLSPGDTVVVESPTYDRTLLYLRRRQLKVVAVEVEEDGLAVERLEELLAGGERPRLVHTIPNHHNPAGFTLSEAKRRRLVELAGRYGFTILEDDPYGELSFDGSKLPTLRSLDPTRVLYVSSFTKILCPGVRTGFLIAPKERIEELLPVAANTYISPNMFSEATANVYCRSEAFEAGIVRIREALARRAAVLCEELAARLPELRFTPPKGGYFLWVELPEGLDSTKLVAEAARRGVVCVPGTDFMLEGGERAFRIAYSGVSEEEIRQGVAHLADAYAALKP